MKDSVVKLLTCCSFHRRSGLTLAVEDEARPSGLLIVEGEGDWVFFWEGMASMESKGYTLVMGGQARLPKELSAGEVFQVVVELDPTKAEVLEVSFAPCLPVIERMLRPLMIGMNLEADLNPVLEEIERRLHHKSKKAVMTAIKDLVREYREYRYRTSTPSEKRLEGFQWILILLMLSACNLL